MIWKVLGFWSKCFKNILATPGCSQRSLYTQSGMYKLLSFNIIIIIIIQSPEGLKLSNWNLVHNQIKIPFSCKMSKMFYDKTCTCHKSLSGKFLKGNFIHYSELFLHTIHFTFININITVILVTKNSVFLYIKSNIIRNMLIIGGFCLTWWMCYRQKLCSLFTF